MFNLLNFIVSTYVDHVKKFSGINKNPEKPPVSEAVKEILRQNFTNEIEFFEFCKQRLNRQYLAIGGIGDG